MAERTADTPKAVHEAPCAAQSALHEQARSGVDVDRVPLWTAQIQTLIDAVEEHRPLGPDGKHGERHTDTCGCEGRCEQWFIELVPPTG